MITRLSLGKIRILILPQAGLDVISKLCAIPKESLSSDVLVLPLGEAEFAAILKSFARSLKKS